MRQRVIIIGAGIVGAACARAVAREGFHVIVIDAKSPGSGATAAGMGHVPVMDDSPAQFALCHNSQKMWDDLAPQLPDGAEYERCGTLWVAADDEEVAEVHRKHAFNLSHGLPSRVLDSAEVAATEPQLRAGLAGGLLLEGDSVVYPPVVAQWMLSRLAADGHDVRIGVAVSSWHGRLARDVSANMGGTPVPRGGVAVTLTDGTTLEADFVVIAAGVKSAALVADLPIRYRKGHLVITDRYKRFVTRQVLELGYLKSAHGSDEDSVAFNVQPRPTGQLLIGSSRQFDVSDPSVDPTILHKMIDRATLYMPDLANVSTLRVWTGFRAATPDSLPIIGPTVDTPNVLLATGHEGLGITTSMGTAELIAAHLTGRTPTIDATPYLPARFAHAGEGHG